MVGNILNLMSSGADLREVLDGYPELSPQDVYAALAYAESVINEEVVLSAS